MTSSIANKFHAAIEEIAAEVLPGFSVLLGTWADTDRMTDMATYPVLFDILSVSGGGVIRNGRIYDYEDVFLTFADKVPFDASGKENVEAVERMVTAAKQFVVGVNRDGRFLPVTDFQLTFGYEQGANIHTYANLQLRLESVAGICPSDLFEDDTVEPGTSGNTETPGTSETSESTENTEG